MTDAQSRPSSIAYRPDVDGLRAVAVMLVLLFHCGIRGFGGGFVGVDVFFVISGFLITSLILADLQAGTFSFPRFYGRRIRRLLPALLVTVLLSLLVATLVMTPEHLADAAKSGALATISLCNFYFSKAASYFDSSSHQKPFLHMWSLSLEEQFYLFWPAVLFVLHGRRRRWLIPALVGAGVPIGLALSEYWITRNPRQAYFLLPFRGYEFLMGASCIWILRLEIRSRLLSQAIAASGLLLILIAAVVFSESTPFPGVAAALPSVGAMLVIWQGGRFSMRHLLGNRAMVWFGRISYSTYLVHWPIIVFWLYLAVAPPALPTRLILLVLSVAAGQLLDSLVAQRYRHTPADPAARRLFPAMQIGLIALIGVFGMAVLGTDGLPRRFALVPDVANYRNQSLFPFLRDYGDGVLHIGSGGPRRVLIFGDSMAQNYIPAMLQLDGIRNAKVDIVSRGGCTFAMDAVLINYGTPDRTCLALRDYLYRIQDQYDLVIWSQNWLGYGDSLHWQSAATAPTPALSAAAGFSRWRDGVAGTLEHFASQTKKMVVIGPPIAVEVNPIIQRIGPLTNIVAVAAQLQLMREMPALERNSLEAGLRSFVTSRPNTLYIDPRQIMCDDGTCRLSDGRFSYYLDSLHNTAAALPLLRIGLERAGL